MPLVATGSLVLLLLLELEAAAVVQGDHRISA